MSAAAPQDALPARNGNGHATAIAPTTPDDFFSRILAHPEIDAAKVSALWAINREVIDYHAKIAYHEAHARAQAEYPVVERDGSNDQTNSRYAKFETIWEQCCPIWTKHGLTVGFDSRTQPSGKLRVTIRVSHGAHTEEYHAPDAASDDRGIKGTVNKTEVQGNQATVTYIKRGLLCSAMGIVTRNEDDDGNSGSRASHTQQHPQHDPAPLTKWAEDVDARMAANNGKNWKAVLLDGLNTAPTLADLEALVDLTALFVAQQARDIRTEIGVAIAAARKRLIPARTVQTPSAEKPAEFSYRLLDAWGEVTDMPFRDARSFAMALLKLWNDAPDQQGRDNILQHNAEAISESGDTHLVTLLAEINGRTPAEQNQPESPPAESPVTPLIYTAVRPPVNNGCTAWVAWPGLVRDELASIGEGDLDSFVLAQRGVLAEAPEAMRRQTIIALRGAYDPTPRAAPNWLSNVHERWVDDRAYDLSQIPDAPDGRAFFDALVRSNTTQTVMQRIKAEDPQLFRRANSMFTDKHNKLPPAPAQGKAP